MNILSPTAKKTIGSVMMLLGFGAFAFSTNVYLNPLKEPDNDAIKASAIQGCKGQAEEFGYLSHQKGESIEFIQHGLDHWESDIAGFSMVLSQCRGFKLDEFCMGSSCMSESTPIHGTIMKLSLNSVE